MLKNLRWFITTQESSCLSSQFLWNSRLLVYDVLDFIFNYCKCSSAEKTKYRRWIRKTKKNTKAASTVSIGGAADTWPRGWCFHLRTPLRDRCVPREERTASLHDWMSRAQWQFSMSLLWGSHCEFYPELSTRSDPPLRQKGDQTPCCLLHLPSRPKNPKYKSGPFLCVDHCCKSVWGRGRDGEIGQHSGHRWIPSGTFHM